MQALACIADALSQSDLDIHMNIFIFRIEYIQLSGFYFLQDLLEACYDLFCFVLLNDALLAQHGSVRDRAGDIFLI